ncbi:NACHT, LRR and PYD domains-containing protein 6-like [Alosa alosa]|uniref:NACHT, LRR and PYD domains-containing protein 6-like n=1 Tax=Alosa alosa TaxID=278164 RepID=UPI0020155319|nr:NACHT, LRR and PYD domains-containing protein 6-like [Alosa alosa]
MHLLQLVFGKPTTSHTVSSLEGFTTNPVQDALSDIIENLNEADFKKFKHLLKGEIPWSKLEKADAIDLIVQTFTEKFSGKVVVNILKKMNLNQMASDLQECPFQFVW